MAATVLAIACIPCAPAQERPATTGVKPIRGTWLNLFYQDGRNKYTNPPGVDLMAPELWRTKIGEMSEMGIRYLIFLAVANEGKALYESDFLPRAYKPENESPVSAIMKAADENGLKVFMSCGWALSQDEDLNKPEVRELHRRIMQECASRFAGHPSFYGWYFPCEFSAAPNISDASVAGVNALAAEARKLTPKARLMISPYLPSRAMVDEAYVRQLAKLNVDIVAYQDGVGCAFTAQPAVGEIFGRLRRAHDQVPRIALWGNVETFTWESGVNRRDSALVPAAFPRVLSQMAAVSSSVDETITWIVQGLFDKPGSPLPVGQPPASAKLAGNYMDFLAGKGRWPLLTSSFVGTLTHEAVGKSVSLSTPPSPKYDKGNLSDGRLANEDYSDARWLGFEKTDLAATVDLGRSVPVRQLAGRFLQNAKAGVSLPSRVAFSISDDGKNFRQVASVAPETWLHDTHDSWIDLALTGDLSEQGRYVRMHAVNRGQWLFADEVLVNPAVDGGSVPLPAAHAHNDYAHARPLLDALERGFCSVEADIFLTNGLLQVGHTAQELRPARTLESLYLEPLRLRIRQNGGRVYRDGPTVTLAIDFKTAPQPTYAELRKVLAAYADILTAVENGKVTQRAVTVILSGTAPRAELAADSPRYAMLDGRATDLDSVSPPDLLPWISESWKKFFAWRGEGAMPEAERARLREVVGKAHKAGRKVRFWGAPDAPAVWKELRAAGVDLLSVDDLDGARRFLLQEDQHR